MADQSANTCVWFEIPCTDLEAAQAFYEATLQITMTRIDEGPAPMVAFSSMDDAGVSGHLRPGQPASGGGGNTVHLAVRDSLEDAMARLEDAGGKVSSGIMPLPGGARFVYCEDLDGNSIGLFSA